MKIPMIIALSLATTLAGAAEEHEGVMAYATKGPDPDVPFVYLQDCSIEVVDDMFTIKTKDFMSQSEIELSGQINGPSVVLMGDYPYDTAMGASDAQYRGVLTYSNHHNKLKGELIVIRNTKTVLRGWCALQIDGDLSDVFSALPKGDPGTPGEPPREATGESP